jgi:hypothetical protein
MTAARSRAILPDFWIFSNGLSYFHHGRWSVRLSQPTLVHEKGGF